MASWTSRTSHLPSFDTERSARSRRYFGGDVTPGVEVRRGKDGSEVYALKPGTAVEADPTAALMAELEEQRRARMAKP